MKHPIDTQVIKEKQTCLLAETRGKNHANHFILTRWRAGRKEKAAADGFPPEGHALLKPLFQGCW